MRKYPNENKVSKLVEVYVTSSVEGVNLETVLKANKQLISALNATEKGSLIRNLDLVVREAGLTGTKEHEIIVKAFSKINDARSLLEKLEESIKSKIEETESPSTKYEESENNDNNIEDDENDEDEVESEVDEKSEKKSQPVKKEKKVKKVVKQPSKDKAKQPSKDKLDEELDGIEDEISNED